MPKTSKPCVFISPFRYPGGKRTFIPFITDMIHASGPCKMFVEPFAGGAAVSIGLLESGVTENIILNDAFGPIADFWHTVFSEDAMALSERVAACFPTIEQWYDISAQPLTDDAAENAFRVLFLNRTSFSGVVNKRAGPIGGRLQTSIYGVACRWNGARLASRILELSKLRDRVSWVGDGGWEKVSAAVVRECTARGLDAEYAFWYLDPPYFRKANKIYGAWFKPEEHRRLHGFLTSDMAPRHWVLSYDLVPEAKDMWGEHLGYSEDKFSTFYVMRRDRTKEHMVKRSEIVVLSENLLTCIDNRI